MVGLAKEKRIVDTVFMDPPCSGSNEKFLSSLVRLAPKQIIYILCNPMTQERDIRYLEQHNYVVKEIQPVDMFPQTAHIEVIIMMTYCGQKEKKTV